MDFSELSENVKGFVTEKPLLATIIGIFAVLFLASLVILTIQTSKPKVQKQTFKQEMFTADAKLLIPAAPEAEKDYYPSRTQKKNWSEEEVMPWFTTPDQVAIEGLEKANDTIISDITGAAP